jgi:hypothetical protein
MYLDKIGGESHFPKKTPIQSKTSHGSQDHISSQTILGTSITGQSCYVDMGKFYGNNIWNCMDWSKTPGTISTDLLNKGFLGNFFTQLKNEGVNKIDLSFAQISDINNLYQDSLMPPQGNGTAYSATDSFQQVLHTIDSSGKAFSEPPYAVTNKNGLEVAPNFLSYFIHEAHLQGIKVDLSFGGGSASATDPKLPGDPTTAANNLSDMMKNFDFDSVDFDIENQFLAKDNSANDLNTFFTTLHQNLSAQGKESTVTLMGGALNDHANYGALTDNLTSKFDSVNLMLYSTTQYYLSAKPNNVWPGVEAWIQAVGGDASKLHLGFYDSIPYETAAANGDGSTYQIQPGSSRGQAAAQIYQQLSNQLEQDGYTGNGKPSLGQPFFWIDTPGDPNSAQVMQDFYNTLKGVSKNPWS